MQLKIRGRVINAPIKVILDTLKREIRTGKLKDIEDEVNDNIAITCPIHKMGKESNPSCNVYCRKDNDKVEYGKCHCFTCGFTASLPQLVKICFGELDDNFGEEWLIERFGTFSGNEFDDLPEIVLPKRRRVECLPEESIVPYEYYNDYMWTRGISREVINKFQVGYNPERQALTFPVWDENDRLVMVTSRSVKDKSFYIEKDKDKPVYLLNFLKKEGITTAYVCESQLNALTLWSYGYPAVALFGTGSGYQYDILNKSHIRSYVLCFDGDDAGDKGIQRFLKHIRKDVFISIIRVPRGKDVNDLSKEEFENLKTVY